jgi:hypothetical protein
MRRPGAAGVRPVALRHSYEPNSFRRGRAVAGIVDFSDVASERRLPPVYPGEMRCHAGDGP